MMRAIVRKSSQEYGILNGIKMLPTFDIQGNAQNISYP